MGKNEKVSNKVTAVNSEIEKVYISIKEILELHEAGKWVIPNIQRSFVYTAKDQKAVITAMLAGKSYGRLELVRRKDDSYEVIDGQQRSMSAILYLQKEDVSEEDKEKVLSYTFPAIVHTVHLTDDETLEIFESINGFAGKKLKAGELASNHVELPLNWQVSASFDNMSLNTKRSDNVALYQYTGQLRDMANSGEFTDFNLYKFAYTAEFSSDMKKALNYLNSGIGCKEKWLKLSSLPFVLHFAVMAESEGYSPASYAGFVQEFFLNDTKESVIFKASSTAGTTKKASIIARFNAFKEAYDKSVIDSYCYRIPEAKKEKMLKKAKENKKIAELEKQVAELKEIALIAQGLDS